MHFSLYIFISIVYSTVRFTGTDVHDSGVCAGKDCFFVVGGRQRGNAVSRFDLKANEWTKLPDMETSRRCPGEWASCGFGRGYNSGTRILFSTMVG